jgi:F0F1-type ATP synthase epsilon subunit
MRTRRSPLTTLLVAIVLLSVGVGVAVSEHSHAVATLNGGLATRASQQAEVLDDYFARAQSIDLVGCENADSRRDQSFRTIRRCSSCSG